MSNKIKIEELKHNGKKFSVVWDNGRGGESPQFHVMRSGDYCIQIHCDGLRKKHQYFYGGEEVELLHEILGMCIEEWKEKKRKDEEAYQEIKAEADKLGMSFKEYLFKVHYKKQV